MKRFIVIFGLLVFLLPGIARSQGINSIVCFPAAPTALDSIKVVVSTWLPNAPCWVGLSSINHQGQNITIDAKYEDGMLTVICYCTDTFRMGPLPPGTYNGHFHLIYPWGSNIIHDSATFSFTVSGGVGIAEKIATTGLIIVPNPAKERIDVLYRLTTAEKAEEILMYDLLGRQIGRYPLAGNSDGKLSISLSYPTGNYILALRTDRGRLSKGIFTVIH